MRLIENIKSIFLHSNNLSAVPERIKLTLRKREQANEVVVRIIQLLIVVMFSLLYALAAKTGPTTGFQPVPYVLTAYFVLSVIGLIWSVKAELPAWSVYGSILFDFTLLYTLMVSFHFQYEQPASFVLKAPTLLYVFIFIALRALRQEWKYVAAAGITAALGWALLVIYITTIDSDDTMITRSYVQYLTSNSVLIGAEVDKIISILAVTGILTLVVNSSSNLLVTAATEQAAANDFSRFFDKRIAQGIRSSQTVFEAGQCVRRNIAVINIDIRGFSMISATREPSQVMQLLSAYQRRVVPILQDHGAIIDKFMGDGIMATIGIDDDEIPFSRRSIEAAEAVLLDSRKWQDEEPSLAAAGITTIGIGIACGQVVFGAVGQGDRLEMTVIGSPVNTSAKLERHNKVLHTNCIISRNTWDSAIKEGFVAKLKYELMKTTVDGIAGEKKIVILKT